SAMAAEGLVGLGPKLDAGASAWLDDAPRDGQDFGAMGLLQLLARMHTQLDEAERLLPTRPRRPEHAYDLFDAHPFHLAMGSYLSAAGLAAAAFLVVTVLVARSGQRFTAGDELLWADGAGALDSNA